MRTFLANWTCEHLFFQCTHFGHRGHWLFWKILWKTNDIKWLMIYNQILSTTWCQESSETEFPLKLMSLLNTGLERSPFSVLPIFVFPPTWISDLDSNTLHKMLRVVFQENLFHSRGWLGERWVERKSVWSHIFKITGIAESNFEISQTHPSLTSNILPHENHNLPRNYLRHPATGCFSGDIFDWMTCGRWQIKP